MSPKIASVAVALALAALVGCQKRAEAPAQSTTPPPPKPVAVQVVKENERSRNFMAVNQHLELGGTLYGYIDVEGDVLKLTSGLQDFVKQMAATQPQLAPVAKQDFAALATTLGLTDIKAVGISSVPDGTGFFRNRAFFYAPGERHGLLLGLGGKPGPFTHVKLAPADTAFFGEAELDLPVVYRTIKDVVVKVAGEQAAAQMETALKQAGAKASFSLLDFIGGLKGHTSVVLRVDPEKTIKLPGNELTLPAFALLVTIDGVAPVLEEALAKSPAFKKTEDGTLHYYEFGARSPIPELQPVFVADGKTLYLASTKAFFDECRSLKSGLAQTPEYQRATAEVGAEGNAIGYVHPRFFEQVRRIESLNPSLPPQMKPVFSLIVSKLPKVDRPLVAVRSNLPDGILVRSSYHRSLKQEVAMVAVYNPVTVGVIAAMAVPAFQKVRMASQEKAIINNLRQLSAAADQYYLEHGVQSASYEALVGADKYIPRLVPVAGEDYRQVRFVQGQPLRVRLPSGRIIQYPMPRQQN